MILFDGKQASRNIIASLRDILERKDKKLQIATILVGDDKASEIYTKLKQKAANDIGAKMLVFQFSENELILNIKRQINNLNKDKSVSGIMIQLPLPKKISKYRHELIDLIDPEKDVDGLKINSKFTPATVRAILTILDMAKSGNFITKDSKIAIVGSKGSIGSALMKEITATGFDIEDDLKKLKNYDVIISATGKSGLIKSENIKNNSVLIDVGAPKAEFEKDCFEKASFATPVPGGVGPMTVASLMQNLVDAAI